MIATLEPLTGRGWSVRRDQSCTVVVLSGDWIARDAAVAGPDSVSRILDGAETDRIAFEADQLGHWDSALLAFLLALRQGARQRDIPLDDGGLPRAATRLLGSVSYTHLTLPTNREV